MLFSFRNYMQITSLTSDDAQGTSPFRPLRIDWIEGYLTDADVEPLAELPFDNDDEEWRQSDRFCSEGSHTQHI